MNKKILFVDHDPTVLDGYRRVLHDAVRPDTAVGGHQALEFVANAGP